MTDREKAIVTAYTGACMLNGDKFRIFHGYIEDIMGRPVYMHELANKAVVDEIKEKAKADFITLCAEQEPFINKPCVSSEVCEHDKNKMLDKIMAEILEEKECAYADFEEYKIEYLGVEAEYVEDELPQDDYRYGMERAIEIINKYKAESDNSVTNGQISKIKKEYFVMDEYGYTDKELVDTVNELIDKVNELIAQMPYKVESEVEE